MDLVFPRSTSSVIPQSELSNSGISGVFYSPCPTQIHFLVPTLTLDLAGVGLTLSLVIADDDVPVAQIAQGNVVIAV